MCGIAGIYNYQSPNQYSTESLVKNMLSLISHRGPDESGAFVDNHVGIGNVRLSIIDLSSGQQPLCDESGRFWIVYNGEVFNYDELRNELIQKGMQFKTHCDTEVVVQMYARYGASCLNRLNGQFAFAIWDTVKKELFLARDRVGIRPVFYWYQNNSFAFCSEIKGLFSLDKIEKKISAESMSQIFTFWTTLTPKTPFQNIFELQPGHYMTVNSNGLNIQKFWSLNYPDRKEIVQKPISETVGQLDELLFDAVRIRLKADVPVGAYLSGGLDSSVTTSYIKTIHPDILNTFSIGFQDASFDETNFQLEAARYFKTNHLAFKCSSDEIAENLGEAIWHTEFPILRTSPVPMFLLSKKVRENNIKVVITGEGADEMLAGYNIFKEAKIRRFWAGDPKSKIRPRLLTKLYPYLSGLKNSPDLALKMFFGFRLSDTTDPLYSHLLRWHNTGRLRAFLFNGETSPTNDFLADAQLTQSLPKGFDRWSDLAKSQYLEATIFMSGYLLSSQGDRMAMGNSVEGRYPFLDYRVMEFCAQLPDSHKLNSLNEKFILKKLSQGRIPPSITSRPKQPYRAPIASMLNSEGLREYFNDLLSEDSLRKSGVFNPEKVRALMTNVSRQDSVSEVDQMAIAGILSTQILHTRFVSEKVAGNPERLTNYRLIDHSKANR